MAYPQLSLYWALVLNLVPVAVFILLCYVAKSDTQLAYAAILSTIYSLVMMLVIVGLIKQAADNGFCSVTTVFLLFVAGVFVISAFIHPQEFWCILHGFLYFLAIPSMSMLLMLYSIGNLHVVSWGTRETPKPAQAQKPGEASKPVEKKGAVAEWLEKIGIADKEGKSGYRFSFGNLFRCVCCPTDTGDTGDMKLSAILDRLDELEAKIVDPPGSHVTGMDFRGEKEVDNKTFSEVSDMFEGAKDRDDAGGPKMNRSWLEDADFKKSAQEYIKPDETKFWVELIASYLFPLEEDKKQQAKTKEELLELRPLSLNRNTVCLFFLLVNALFVTIVFSLQQVNSDSGGSIAIELPCADGAKGEAIEPISIAFTAVFGVLLLIQFLCMCVHRMSTFLQILSITEVNVRSPRQVSSDEREITVEKGLQLVKNMQALKDDDVKSMASVDASVAEGEQRDAEETDVVGQNDGTDPRKNLWAKLARRRREQQYSTLSNNFMRNFKKLQRHMEDTEMSSNMNLTAGNTLRVPAFSFSPTEEDVTERKTVRRKIKQSILKRGNVVAKRWQRAALRAKIQNARDSAERGATGNEATDGADGGGYAVPRKVTIADIAQLAVVDNESNAPSETESEGEVIQQTTF
ncbi:CHS2-like protein [Mya arenaria]|uniref:CHS2-like protein n=1 Tax=Mya arenaria TaxID=6604 RepID=A0ABY7EM06_MYAAR|nr:CHS2-like protein [Mya arenaria]